MNQADKKQLKIAVSSRRDPLSRLERFASRYVVRKLAHLSFARPVVSFTFDDVPISAVENGARLLSAKRKSGTFYLASGLCNASFGPWTGFREADLENLIEQGHEIGCHTFDHPDIQTLSNSQLREQLEQNRDWLRERDQNLVLNSFAYPYGSMGLKQKRLVSGCFDTCRGVRHGLNNGWADLAQLFAVQLYNVNQTAESLERIIAKTVREKSWLIFYTHDVRDNPTPHGCSPQLLETAIQLAEDAGCIILPVRDALKTGMSDRAG